MEGPRWIWWNFVSSRRDRIEQAQEEWRRGRFDTVPGDEAEFIPLPDTNTKPRRAWRGIYKHFDAGGHKLERAASPGTERLRGSWTRTGLSARRPSIRPVCSPA